MRIEASLLAGLVGLTACGGDDGGADTPSFCQQLQQKHDACSVGITLNCSPYSAPPASIEEAFRACLFPFDCTSWRTFAVTLWMSTATVTCFSEHGVKFTGVFACSDGNGSVAAETQCNGTANCPDRSDEAGC
jgi:hypothetical protein